MNSKILKDDASDLDADLYTKNSSLQNNLAKEIIESLQIAPNSLILDIGCGDGRITAELSRLANQGSVLGIDASSNMIDFALINFPKAEFPNLNFRRTMAESLELKQKYDHIVSFSCFHWLKDPRSVMRRISANLKKGGELLILTYPKESPYYRYLQAALKDYPKYYPLFRKSWHACY